MSTQDTVSARWPAAVATVPAARQLVRQHLVRQGEQGLVEGAELLVSELVSNVVLHVGGLVDVAVSVAAGVVRIEVSDQSPESPRLRLLSSGSPTGRGMRLVQALAAESGVVQHGRGKTIWVQLTAVSASRSDDELLAAFGSVDWLGHVGDVAVPDGQPAPTQDPLLVQSGGCGPRPSLAA